MKSESIATFQPLATKLSAPEYVQRALPRKSLEFPYDLKFVGVVAPAGYGKSTLMAQWKSELESQGARGAWLNLDEDENNFANFFRYLVHSFHEIAPEACASAVVTLAAGSFTNPKPIWQSLVHALAQDAGRYVLFLDDFHKVTQRDVLAFVDWMLRNLPKNLQLVLASRLKLPLGIHRLVSYGDARIYGCEDLSFDLEETKLFFNEFHRFQLAPEQIQNIHRNSEGWVLVLQMVSILARRKQDLGAVIAKFSGKHEELGNYLGEVILDSVDPELRVLLCRLSVLDRFCAELVDDLSGTSNAAQSLRRLQEMNLFVIALDSENLWFRFHHLFGEFLGEILKREHPEATASLRLRASLWFERQDLFHEAIEYALRAKDFDRAGQLIASYVPEIVENKGDTDTLLQWMQRLPQEYKIKYPAMWPSVILSCFITHDIKRAREETRLFRQSFHQAFDQGKLSPSEFNEFEEAVHCLQADSDVFDFKVQKFRDGLDAWLEKAPESDIRKITSAMCIGATSIFTHEYDLGLRAVSPALKICVEVGNYCAYAWAASVFASLSVRRGNLSQAIRTIGAYHPLIEEKLGEQNFASHLLAFQYAECLSLQGKVDEAWSYLKTPLQYLENWGSHHNSMACLTTYVRLLALRRDFSEALRHAQFGKRLGKRRRHRFLVAYFKSLEIEIHLLRKDFSTAKKIFESLGEESISASEDRFLALLQKELQFLSKVKLALYQKQAWQLVAKLEAYVDSLRGSERVRDLIAALVLQAAALCQDKQREKAVVALVEALECAAPGEYVLPFVEQRDYLRDFFREAFEVFRQRRGFEIGEEYERRLVELMQVETSEYPSLGVRELEVLKVLESGKSNQELARQLFISEATLKWHLHRLFRKFGVKNRTGLIFAAKKAKVFEEL